MRLANPRRADQHRHFCRVENLRLKNSRIGQAVALDQSVQFIHEGIRHIWLGFTMSSSCSPSCFPLSWSGRKAAGKRPREFSSVAERLQRIVTAFTVAHSLTLSLAALDVIRLPSRLVESTIAASVVLAGLGNLYPFSAIGLFDDCLWFRSHFRMDLGFAAVITDLGLPHEFFIIESGSFNIE